ncbi:MAG: hypothetical protein Fur002_21360 [Anaerolineales bacterium]
MPKRTAATLEEILNACLTPQTLDSHAWAKSLVAEETAQKLADKTPGQRLVIAIAERFIAQTPAKPPLRGAPLNEDWGGFALLAAEYFAPLLFGKPKPASLQDAAAQMYESALLFTLNGKKPAEREKAAYLPLTNAPQDEKTLRAWRAAALKKLGAALSAREAYLSKKLRAPAILPIHAKRRAASAPKTLTPRQWTIRIAAAALLVASLAVIFWKVNQIRALAQAVQADVDYMQSLASESEMRLGRVKNIGSAAALLHKDFHALYAETRAFYWAAPLFAWTPEYGADVKQIRPLTRFADALLNATDLAYQAVAPLAEDGELSSVNPSELTDFLIKNQLALSHAYKALQDAQARRGEIDVNALSPKTREIITAYADPLMQYMQDGLTVAVQIPALMGAGKSGAKTYLLLVQNEDELRPTGGFITAASAVTMLDGQLNGLSFVNSGGLDNWYKLYPAAPWQLKEYMNSPVLVFRDSNWFSDYSATAAYAKFLYSYTNEGELDGVIAFDQRFLIEMLEATGPILVEGEPRPIDALNVAKYMRESKTPDRTEAGSPDWNNKAFLNKLAYALLGKIFSGEAKWETVSAALLKALNERHLLAQVDNPSIAALLARYRWDGSIQPGGGDFLMAVDSNIGFNKTNAVVEESLDYSVDLSDLSAPTATLATLHKNNAAQNVICKQWLKQKFKEEAGYPITDCYWNYLRVYKTVGTTLVSATPQVVPDAWMILRQKNAGQVDLLTEDIAGVESFGTLEVVPTGEALPIQFNFALPPHVLNIQNDQAAYMLKVQKQPGTLSIPIAVRIHLPSGARVLSSTPGAVIQGEDILYNAQLVTDLEFTVLFSIR